jgi:hypothetical protein
MATARLLSLDPAWASRPLSPLPQQYVVDPVDAHALVFPAARTLTFANSVPGLDVTATGDDLELVVPSPNWPNPL